MDLEPFAALVLSLPSKNKTVRMRIWRALRGLGCGVLRDGVYLLPGRAVQASSLARLESDVKAAGGFAMTVELRLKSSGQLDTVRKLFDKTNDYASAIAQLKALGHDDSAAVANLIGYSYRKLGDYKVSQIWYERALKADPDHVKTWQYYGLWQVEQGNRDQAQYHLNRIAALTGTSSEEYRSLAAALEKPPGTGLVY